MILYTLLLVALLFVISAGTAHAVCPVCTIAIGAGIGLSRWLGIDDTLSGIWIGGFILSSSLWFVSYLKSKNINFPHKEYITTSIMAAITIIPLYISKIIGHPLNTIWGVDKIIVGIVFGLILFLISLGMDKYLRSKNEGKAFIQFQKVLLPVMLLLLGSIFFYTIT